MQLLGCVDPLCDPLLVLVHLMFCSGEIPVLAVRVEVVDYGLHVLVTDLLALLLTLNGHRVGRQTQRLQFPTWMPKA